MIQILALYAPMEVVILKKVKSVVKGVVNFSAFLSALVVVFMMFLTVADVVGRRFFNSPVAGTFELTRISLVIIVFTGLGLAHFDGENIGISILFDKFNKKLQKILDVIISIISIGLFWLVIINTFKYAKRIANANLVTSVLRLPMYPWIYISAFGVAILILALIWSLIESIQSFKGEITDES